MKKKEKKNSKSSKRILVISSVSIVILAAVSIFIFLFIRGNTDKPIGQVDDYTITEEEFLFYSDQFKNMVSTYYYQTYDADVNAKDFWITDYEGESPADTLKEYTKEAVVKAITIRKAAKDLAIDEDFTFEELKLAFEKENKSRAAKSTDPSDFNYGPDEYSLAQYISYMETAAIDDLKTILLTTELSPSEDNLRQAYESLDESLLDQGYRATLAEYTCTDNQYADEVKSALEQELEKGTDPANVVDALPEYADILATEITELSSDIHREDTSGQAIYDFYRNEEAEKLGGPRTEFADFSIFYYIYDKEEYDKLPFEEAVDMARNKWINDQFDKYIQSLIDASSIAWDETVLNKINYNN